MTCKTIDVRPLQGPFSELNEASPFSSNNNTTNEKKIADDGGLHSDPFKLFNNVNNLVHSNNTMTKREVHLQSWQQNDEPTVVTSN